ncbi:MULTISPECIES: flagellar filament capping protein FliD [Sphingobium]|uniref:flagellar filament capping protein FliD n=1 Tax=Sphingobium sp. MI1205 TaxID=407020 RepID=UPI0007704308|nr:flagellar filament capping protein FliD [Sphingobium sp. MI1205]AMK18989.1 flagellar hook-associated protein 2 [Sphingobium sp. MI1205]
MTSVSSSIATALGIGSGIDTGALVTSLVSAARDPKQKAITDRQSTNNAKISALASASSSLNTFADALNSLLAGTGFAGSPASNDPSIAAVSLLPGGVPKLPAQLEVQQLASAQTISSAAEAGATAASPVGAGSFELKIGTGAPVTVTLTAPNTSYADLAAAINAQGTGVTASVITDNQGTRLVMKGETGAANSFTFTQVSGDASLAAFTWDGAAGGMTRQVEAKDSIILLDGVEQHYSSNTIDTAIANLRIDLNKAAPGTAVTLASTEPTTSMRDLMVEFVDAYNTLMKALNTASQASAGSSGAGVLNGDSSIRDMKRQLSQMTSTVLATSGTYTTLSSIGVSTNRDGTLKLDTEALDKALAADAKGITQMLNPAVKSETTPGLAGLMDGVRDRIEQNDGPLAMAKAKYEQLGEDLAEQLEKLNDQMTDYQAQLSKVYTAMETRLSALKATQSYLEQQVAMWTKSDD